MNYDLNFWFGFLGIFFSLLFGLLSIYQYKQNKYPGEITYFNEQTIGLFDTLIRNFPQISIKYEGSDINQQIVLLKGFFLNTGRIDIKKEMVDEKLKIELPEGFKWLRVQIVDSSFDNLAKTQIVKDTQLEFDLGLFKKNEFIRFESLINIPNEEVLKLKNLDNLNQKIKFKHRIADTSKVEKKRFNLELPNLKKNLIVGSLFTTVLIIFLGFIIFIMNIERVRGDFYYQIHEKDTTLIVRAFPKTNNKIYLLLPNGDEYKTISLDEFKTRIKDFQIKPKSKKVFGILDEYSILLIVWILLILWFSWLFIIKEIRDYRKINRIRGIMNPYILTPV